MKKSITLTLLSLTTLNAGEPCCECVPQPAKCINCECYSPAYYNLQCDSGFFISADLLYWFSRESNLDYAVQAVCVSPSTPLPFGADVLVPTETIELNTNWSPGVRLALGVNTRCDGWDALVAWTYYHNHKQNTSTVPADYSNQSDPRFPSPGESTLVNPWIETAINGGSFFSFDSITGKWNLTLNELDLELGRKFWLSRAFTLRPYTGVRIAWIRSQFQTFSARHATLPFPFSGGPFLFHDKFTNHTWGVGLLGGIQPEWYLGKCFSVFGNLEASLIWGKVKSNKNELYSEPEFVFENNWNSHFTSMQTILDLALGLRWEDTWCSDRYRVGFDLGWEQHIWFDFNRRTRTIDPFLSSAVQFADGTALPVSAVIDPPLSGFSNIDEVVSNLMMGGVVVRARVDF